MIVVLGRPGLTADDHIDRPAGRIALAAARAGGRVELVGSVGDDADGDAVVVELGQAGIGHAAVLRDPAGNTPRAGEGEADGANRRLPRLDATDIDLGLSYLSECHVLVVADDLDRDALKVVADAATYHGASLIVVASDVNGGHDELPDSAIVLGPLTEDGGAFVDLVGHYAAALDSGRVPADAWRDAIDESGWEPATE